MTYPMGIPVYAHDASKWEQLVTPFAASGGRGIDAPPATAKEEIKCPVFD